MIRFSLLGEVIENVANVYITLHGGCIYGKHLFEGDIQLVH